MAQEQHRHSRISTAKMKRRSRWSTIDLSRNRERIIDLERRIEDEVGPSVEAEDNCRNLVVEEVHVEGLKEDDGVRDSVVEDLAGKITINRNDFVMLV
jgi:hypothetical protein